MRSAGQIAFAPLVLLVGCQTPAPARPPAEPHRPARPPARPEDSVEVSSERRVLGPPPKPATWTDIPLSYPDDAVVVRRVDDLTSVVLFPDEAVAVRRQIAQELRRLGYEVVPIDDLQRIESAAAEGRLVLEGDRSCRASLSPADVRARYFSSRPQAHLYADCDEDAKNCRLSVLVGRSGVLPRFVSPPVPAPQDPAAWAKVSLRRDGEAVPGGVLGGIEGGQDLGLRVNATYQVGPWKRSPSAAIVNALTEDRTRCVHTDPRVSVHWELLIAVSRQGAVQRCFARSSALGARAQDGDCLCEQLENVRLDRGRAGRRLKVEAGDPGLTSFSSRRFNVVQPGTRAWVDRISESPDALACLHSASNVETPWRGDAVLAISSRGDVEGVELFGDVSTPQTQDVAHCLVQALNSVSMPCRPPGIDSLHVGVELGPLGG